MNSKLLSLLILALAAGLSAPAGAETNRFALDPMHTGVHFDVDHFGYARVVGRFNEVSGTLDFDPADFAGSSLSVEIATASVDTGQSKRDDHLRSPDFFNAQEFPKMTFVSTKIEKTGEMTARVTGDLTILGTTAPAILEVTFNKIAPHPNPAMNGVIVAGFSATGEVLRSRFGMNYLEGALGDTVALRIEAEAHQQ